MQESSASYQHRHRHRCVHCNVILYNMVHTYVPPELKQHHTCLTPFAHFVLACMQESSASYQHRHRHRCVYCNVILYNMVHTYVPPELKQHHTCLTPFAHFVLACMQESSASYQHRHRHRCVYCNVILYNMVHTYVPPELKQHHTCLTPFAHFVLTQI